MNQEEISRETLDRLRGEREKATDPAVIGGLDNQIRIHSELAGPDPEPAAEPAKPAKSAKAAAAEA